MNYNIYVKKILISRYVFEVIGADSDNANLRLMVANDLSVKLQKAHASISLVIYIYLCIFYTVLSPLKAITGVKAWENYYFKKLPVISSLQSGMLKLTLFSYYGLLS